jgi:copper chaperone NosL
LAATTSSETHAAQQLEEAMNRFLIAANEALSTPLHAATRAVVLALLIPLGVAAAAPLWTLEMAAPQYPAGLELRIYPYTVEGDIQEVNTLNHYIGMAPIDRAALSDLDWLPFAIGVAALLILRVAAIGDLRALVDLVALFTYFGAFSFARFAYTLYVFGHNLNPDAPFDLEPFTPVVIGTGKVANFTITSLPSTGAWALSAVGVALVLLLAASVSGSLRARRSPAA